jgi:hypothetical protein
MCTCLSSSPVLNSPPLSLHQHVLTGEAFLPLDFGLAVEDFILGVFGPVLLFVPGYVLVLCVRSANSLVTSSSCSSFVLRVQVCILCD